MADLPLWRDDTTSNGMSGQPQEQRRRSRVVVMLWLAVTVTTVMVVLGMESRGLTMQSSFTGTLFLAENLQGSPAIGLPESDEDDQYYEWNVVSKALHKDPSVVLVLAESLRGSPAIGAKPLEDDDDEEQESDDDESDEEVSENEETKEEGEPSIFQSMLQIWNGNYRIEDEDVVDSSSDEELYESHEDDLIDSTGAAPGMTLAQE